MSEMKMSDAFVSESGKLVVGNVGKDIYQDIDHNMIDIVGRFETERHASYAAQAIKNYDSLVEELERLRSERDELVSMMSDLISAPNGFYTGTGETTVEMAIRLLEKLEGES